MRNWVRSCKANAGEPLSCFVQFLLILSHIPSHSVCVRKLIVCAAAGNFATLSQVCPGCETANRVRVTGYV